MRRTALFLIAFALVGGSPAVTAAAQGLGLPPLRFHEVLYRVPTHWWGGVSGDLEGMVAYRPDPAHVNTIEGTTVHFYEMFRICIGETPSVSGCTTAWTGSFIAGTDEGVYNKLNPGGRWNFRASGVVTDASPDLAYLIGAKFHENGTTTDPATPPLTGVGDGFFSTE